MEPWVWEVWEPEEWIRAFWGAVRHGILWTVSVVLPFAFTHLQVFSAIYYSLFVEDHNERTTYPYCYLVTRGSLGMAAKVRSKKREPWKAPYFFKFHISSSHMNLYPYNHVAWSFVLELHFVLQKTLIVSGHKNDLSSVMYGCSQDRPV